MAQNTIKLKFIGINRSADDNMATDISCFDMVNLEYRDGCFRPIRLDAIGSVYDKTTDAPVSILANYDFFWLHHISTNKVKWIGLKSDGTLDYLFETDEIDASKKEEETYCVKTTDAVSVKTIATGVVKDQVCFVGNLLVINDSAFNSMSGYNGIVTSDLYIMPRIRRKNAGYACMFGNVGRKGKEDAFKANFNSINSHCLRNGYFQGYSFVRCAIRLMNGEYINITPPVMICSGANSQNHSRYNYTKRETPIAKGEFTPKTKDSDGNIVDLEDNNGTKAKIYVEVYSDKIYLTPCELDADDGNNIKIPLSDGLYSTTIQSYTTVSNTTISIDYKLMYISYQNGRIWTLNDDHTYTVTIAPVTDTNAVNYANSPIKIYDSFLDEDFSMENVISSKCIVSNAKELRRKSVKSKLYKKMESNADKVLLFTDNDTSVVMDTIYGTIKGTTQSVQIKPSNMFDLLNFPEKMCRKLYEVPSYGEYDSFGEQVVVAYGVYLQKTSDFEIAIDSNITEDLNEFIQSVDVFMTKPVSIYYDANDTVFPTNCNYTFLHPKCKTDIEIEREILSSLSSFYKVREMQINELNGTSYVNLNKSIDFTSEIFVAGEVLEDKSEYYDKIIFANQYTNNNAVHSFGIKANIRQTVLPFSYCLTEDYNDVYKYVSSIDADSEDVKVLSRYKYNSVLYTKVSEYYQSKQRRLRRKLIKIDDTSTSEGYVPDSMDAFAKLGLCGVTAVVSSTYDTEYAMLHGKGSINKYGLKMNKVNVGDFTMYYKRYFLGYISSDVDCLDSDNEFINSSNNDEIIVGNNILKVSQTNNPIVYPDKQTYSIGNGSIIGLCANNKEVSQGLYGTYPLYVFTTEGVYAMKIDATGSMMYSSITPVSKEVCINKNTIVGTDYGVVFATENGLCILDGTVVKNISTNLKGSTFDFGSEKEGLLKQILDSWKITKVIDEISFYGNRNSSHDGSNYYGEFLTYLKNENTYCVFNTRKQMLVIYNIGTDNINDTYKLNSFMYLMDLSSGVATKVHSGVRAYITDYPEGYFTMRDANKTIGEGGVNSPNIGIVSTGGGVLNTTLFHFGDTNYSGNDYFVMPSYGDEDGNDFAVSYNNHYSDVAILTRPIKMESEDFKGSVRVVVRGLFHNYFDFNSRYARSVINADKEYLPDSSHTEPVMRVTKEQFFHSKFNGKYGVSKATGLYVFASNDCRRWSLVGAMESANTVKRDLGCTVHHGGYKFLMICVAGRLKDCSYIDYVEIQAKQRYNDKIR